MRKLFVILINVLVVFLLNVVVLHYLWPETKYVSEVDAQQQTYHIFFGDQKETAGENIGNWVVTGGGASYVLTDESAPISPYDFKVRVMDSAGGYELLHLMTSNESHYLKAIQSPEYAGGAVGNFINAIVDFVVCSAFQLHVHTGFSVNKGIKGVIRARWQNAQDEWQYGKVSDWLAAGSPTKGRGFYVPFSFYGSY